jgi:HPt (histidine-containing phosphotransfer) domain-containing protein
VLAAWLGDDRAGIRGIPSRVSRHAIESKQAIDVAWRDADLASLAAAAHRLKGAAQAVGAVRLAATAGRLEQVRKGGDRCRDRLGPLAADCDAPLPKPRAETTRARQCRRIVKRNLKSITVSDLGRTRKRAIATAKAPTRGRLIR